MKGPREVPVPARRCAVAAVLACALGCGGGAPPVSSEVSATWTTRPEYEIGSLHGQRGSFERIADMGVSDDGTRIHVLDAGGRDVSVWTPDGSPVFSVAGDGDGPGEFRGPPRAIDLTSDGFLVLSSDRIVGFSASGIHVETISMPNSVSYRGFRFRPMGKLADGSLLAYPGVRPAYQSGWWGDDPVDHLPVVRIAGRDGGWSVDTLAVPRRDQRSPRNGKSREYGPGAVHGPTVSRLGPGDLPGGIRNGFARAHGRSGPRPS